MQENRRLRLQTAIQEELSQVVSREVKDPRVPPVTFTEVQVTADGSHATIFVSILGSRVAMPEGATEESIREADRLADARMHGCIEGLMSATGFLRRHLAKALQVRHVPTISFKEDRGFENAQRVQELLTKVKREPVVPTPESETVDESDAS
jgi:ribosome-binding factor A